MDSKIAVSPPMRENVTPGHTLIQEVWKDIHGFKPSDL